MSGSHGLRLENVTITAGDKTLVDGVNLEFAPGRCHVILGPSGSGKTTLLRSINRLNELFPGLRMAGRVWVPAEGGHARGRQEDAATAPGRLDPAPIDAARLTGEQLRRRVGMVFQNPNILPVSLAQNFHIPLESALGLDAEQCRRRMTDALQEVGLWKEVADRLDLPADRLSGGQQQRLCLARALAMRPDVLLLDEPTANLDFRATAAIEKLMGRLKQGRVLVVVSHSLAQAGRIADRVAVLSAGHKVLDMDVDGDEDRAHLTRLMGNLFPVEEPPARDQAASGT